MARYGFPRKLEVNNSITIRGRFTSQTLIVVLGGNKGRNVTFEADFESNKVTLMDKTLKWKAVHIFPGFHDNKSFDLDFMIYEQYLKICSEGNDVIQQQMTSDWFGDLRYLTVNNIVKILAFDFDAHL